MNYKNTKNIVYKYLHLLNRMKNNIFLVTIVALAFGCGNHENSSDSVQTSDYSISTKEASNLKFDENLAYSYIEKQVSFGPRNPGSKGHADCANWIMTTLKSLSDTVYFDEFEAITYDSKKFKGKNIVGHLNPKNPNRILLCAHWDTRPIADRDTKNQEQPILGANDAGSGVGVILAILNSLKSQPMDIGIDIVFFDIEDYGQPENSGLPPMEKSWCLGSQHWSKNTKLSTLPRWGILLDMVGGANATFLKEELSTQYASGLQNRIWNNAETLGFKSMFISEAMGQIQDDHLYVNTLAGIPTVDIIHYKQNNEGFADYWHTHNDNLSSVDKNTIKSVGLTVLYTIFEESKFGATAP